MWRALFYAIGCMTTFLGLQSLAFEQVQLAPGKDVLQIVKRVLREDGTGSVPLVSGGVNSPAVDQGVGNSSNASFGPSRFTNGGFGGGAFSAAPYRDLTQNGGLGVRSGQSASVPRVDLAGYQTRVPQSQASAVPVTPGRVIRSKDWMPWSLLAIGTVIVLYTRSFAIRSV